jgi:hypothetical protein
VDHIYDVVVTALRRYRGALPPTQAGEESFGAPPVLDAAQAETLAAILQEVRAIREAVSND